MKPWIVVGSSNGSFNLGDSSMWESAVATVRSTVGQVQVVTDSRQGWEASISDVSVLPWLHEAFRRWPGTPQSRAEAALRLAVNAGATRRGLRLAERFARGSVRGASASAWDQAIKESSGVIFSGAGGITDEFALHGVAGWLAIAGRAQSHGKPVAFIGQGVGPIISPHVRAGAGRMLSCASLVTTRDRLSEQTVLDLGYQGPHVSTADWALALPVDDEDREYAIELHDRLISGKSFIAVSFHDRVTATREEHESLSRLFSDIVAEAARNGLFVVGVANCASFRRADDRIILKRLVDGLPSTLKPRSLVLDERVSPAVARAFLGRAIGVLATRYHPVVFALAEGSPAIGISFDNYYDQKLMGAFEWFGEHGRVFRIGTAVSVRGIVQSFLQDDLRSARVAKTESLVPQIVQPLRNWIGNHHVGSS